MTLNTFSETDSLDFIVDFFAIKQPKKNWIVKLE